MGTWGSDVYENDTSADYLGKIIDKLINNIRVQIRYQLRMDAGYAESQLLICDIDLLALICEHRSIAIPYLPELKDIERWKRVYMDIWDSTVDEIEPTPDYKTGRRKVLVQTFDRLIALAKPEKKVSKRKKPE